MAQYVAARGVDLWIRHVLVPGLTDDADGLRQLDAFIKTLPTVRRVEILPYTLGLFKWQNLGIPYPLDGVRVPTAEEVETAEQLCMCAIIPMHPRAAPQSNFYKILGIIFEKPLTPALPYGKVYSWLGTANHNQPRTVNRLFASPVRFLPITGCASVLAFCSAPFSGLLIAFCPIVLCSGRWGFLCEAQKSQHHGHGKPLPPLCGLYVGRCHHPPRGVGDAALQAANFPAMADVRKRSSLPGLLQGGPGPRPDESDRLREPPGRI